MILLTGAIRCHRTYRFDSLLEENSGLNTVVWFRPLKLSLLVMTTDSIAFQFFDRHFPNQYPFN